jgi:hypothetical protein
MKTHRSVHFGNVGRGTLLLAALAAAFTARTSSAQARESAPVPASAQPSQDARSEFENGRYTNAERLLLPQYRDEGAGEVAYLLAQCHRFGGELPSALYFYIKAARGYALEVRARHQELQGDRSLLEKDAKFAATLSAVDAAVQNLAPVVNNLSRFTLDLGDVEATDVRVDGEGLRQVDDRDLSAIGEVGRDPPVGRGFQIEPAVAETLRGAWIGGVRLASPRVNFRRELKMLIGRNREHRVAFTARNAEGKEWKVELMLPPTENPEVSLRLRDQPATVELAIQRLSANRAIDARGIDESTVSAQLSLPSEEKTYPVATPERTRERGRPLLRLHTSIPATLGKESYDVSVRVPAPLEIAWSNPSSIEVSSNQSSYCRRWNPTTERCSRSSARALGRVRLQPGESFKAALLVRSMAGSEQGPLRGMRPGVQVLLGVVSATALAIGTYAVIQLARPERKAVDGGSLGWIIKVP